MEKFSKIVSDVKEVGQPDQYGNKAFSISFTDGTNGFFKCKDQDLFEVGKQSEFYMGETAGKTGKMYNKIQRVSAVEFDGSGQKKSSTSNPGSVSKDTSDMINRSVAIKAACELLAGSSNNTPDRVLEAADVFYDYIQFGITDKQPANVAMEIKSDPPPSDELPF